MNKIVAIISDTHGYIHPEVLNVVRNCDIVVHAGDIGTQAVLQQLNPKEKIVAVVGNNDSHIDYLEEVRELNLPGGKLIVEHGHHHGHHSPSHISLRETHHTAKVIVYGHTHKQVCDITRQPWVVNPGAAGKTRTHGGASCLRLTANANQDWQIEQLRFTDD